MEKSIRFNIGDAVRYGANGICVVSDKIRRKFSGVNESYFVLSPVGERGSKIYVPETNSALISRIGPVPERENIADALDHPERVSEVWINDESERNGRFREMINSGTCETAIYILFGMLSNRNKRIKAGKSPRSADDILINDIKKTVFGDIAYIFGITYNEAESLFNTKCPEAKGA